MDLSMIVMSHDYSELLSNGLQNDPNFLMIFNLVIREVKLIYIPVNAKFRRLIFSPWKTPKTDIFSEKWLTTTGAHSVINPNHFPQTCFCFEDSIGMLVSKLEWPLKQEKNNIEVKSQNIGIFIDCAKGRDALHVQ